MADFHAADLWVAVVPDVAAVGPAMEKAGRDAKDKFGGGVKGIGKQVNDELEKAGKDAGTIMEDAGKKASTGFRGAFSEIGTTIKSEIGDAFKDIGASVRGGDVAGAFDGVRGKVADVGELTKKVGIDIGDWKSPIDKADGAFGDMTNQAKDALTNVTGISSQFESMPGKIGKIAKGLGEVGVIAATVVETLNAIKDADHWLESHMDWYKSLDEQFKNNPLNKFFHDHFGGGSGGPTATTDADGRPLFAGGGAQARGTYSGGQGHSWDTDAWFFPGEPGPDDPLPGRGRPSLPLPTTHPPGYKPPNPYRAMYPGAFADAPTPDDVPDLSGGSSSGRRGSSGGSSRIGGSGLSSRVTGGVSDRRSLAAAGSRVANLFAFANSLVGTPYSQQLRNDCSGMIAQLASVAVGLPPPSAGDRFSTPNEGQWLLSHGFEPGLGGPNDFNIGWNPAPGNAGHTAATLPGGVHAESGGSHGSFLLGSGAAGAEDPQFSQHAHLSMGRGGIGGEMPRGTEHDPLYVMQPSGSGGADGGKGGPFESQGQQLGQGLVNGVLQMFGLDGSVFGGKSPLDWGAVKLGGGLLNSLMGMAPGGGGGGMAGGGGGLGGMLNGLIPSPGAMVSAAAGPGGGSFGIRNTADPAGYTAYHDNRTIVANNNFRDQRELMWNIHEEQNRRTVGAGSGLPSGGPGSP